MRVNFTDELPNLFRANSNIHLISRMRGLRRVTVVRALTINLLRKVNSTRFIRHEIQRE